MMQIRAVVYGVVQGVGFRYHAQKVAQQLGVTGFVRNLADGSVEVVAAGHEAQVNALLDWAHQGPANAQVSRVEVAPWTGLTTFEDFTVEQ
ncbi:MAG: acylphosphatase [Leptolyngbyaceae cyanobacterium SM2_5_2]|nr:acylphosphatase [Leptolyngbyaceae cyanobacterium SM2_5_2]